MKEAEERDRVEMRARLDVWDDDESDTNPLNPNAFNSVYNNPQAH